jgi:hypothetical protein
MLAFLDESGDTGYKFDRNSSPYFIVTMVIFKSDESAAEVSRGIDALKEEMGKPAVEFHFTNTDDRTRQKFFDVIRKYDFQVCAVV